MQTTNTIAKVFETVLSIRRMNDNVKIQLFILRKNILLLSKVIERALGNDNNCKSPVCICSFSLVNRENFRVAIYHKVEMTCMNLDTVNMSFYIIFFRNLIYKLL